MKIHLGPSLVAKTGCFVALVLLGVGASDVGADDWPQWLGPTRDGVYRETGIVESIPQGGLPVKWRVSVAAGYSGPAVKDNRVFVTDYVVQSGQPFNDPGQRATLNGQERVHCFDAATGQSLWQHSYDCPYSISYPNGPRCTPTVDGDRVYCLGSEGDLNCLQVETGDVIWRRRFKDDLGAEAPLWGYASHPLVEGELLICMVGGPGQTVVAFDKMTGAIRWKALDASGIGYCPPSIIEAGGARQLIVWHADAVVSLNPNDGSEYWNVVLKPSYEMAVARPQREGNLLYACGIHSESVMLRLHGDSPGVTELWRGERNEAVYASNSTPILHDGVVYGADCNDGCLIAVDAQTGKRLWKTFAPTQPDEKRFVKHGTAFLTRLAESDRYLLFGETGDLILASLTAQRYSEQGRFHVVDPTSEAFGRKVVWSHPAYAGRTAFVRNDQELVAVDIAAVKR